jgi:hypothetical protein
VLKSTVKDQQRLITQLNREEDLEGLLPQGSWQVLQPLLGDLTALMKPASSLNTSSSSIADGWCESSVTYLAAGRCSTAQRCARPSAAPRLEHTRPRHDAAG